MSRDVSCAGGGLAEGTWGEPRSQRTRRVTAVLPTVDVSPHSRPLHVPGGTSLRAPCTNPFAGESGTFSSGGSAPPPPVGSRAATTVGPARPSRTKVFPRGPGSRVEGCGRGSGADVGQGGVSLRPPWDQGREAAAGGSRRGPESSGKESEPLPPRPLTSVRESQRGRFPASTLRLRCSGSHPRGILPFSEPGPRPRLRRPVGRVRLGVSQGRRRGPREGGVGDGGRGRREPRRSA